MYRITARHNIDDRVIVVYGSRGVLAVFLSPVGR